MRKLGKCEKGILKILKGHRKLTESEIREKLGRKSAIYTALNRLRQKGLVKRDKNDSGTYQYRKKLADINQRW